MILIATNGSDVKLTVAPLKCIPTGLSGGRIKTRTEPLSFKTFRKPKLDDPEQRILQRFCTN